MLFESNPRPIPAASDTCSGGRRLRKRLLALGLIGWLLFSTGIARPANTAPPAVAALSASLDQTAARVGDLLWLTLKVDLPAGACLSGEPAVSGIDTLDVVAKVVGRSEIKIRFLVDRLDAFQIGPIGVTYLDKDGKEQRLETGPVAVAVRSNLGPKPQEAVLRPIQDIIPTVSKWRSLPAAAMAAAVLLCLAGGWLWWLRKRRRRRMAPPAVDPPHVRAEREIAQLAAGGLFERGEVKMFYFQFSEIIRRYMEAIRPFPAAEMTTEEIARRIGKDSPDQDVLLLLRQAELIKFADAVPTAERKTQDVEGARRYIRQTAPVAAETIDVAWQPEAAS